MLRAAVGITVVFTAVTALVWFKVPIPSGAVEALLPALYVVLLPVRWTIVLVLLIRSLHVRPLWFLPHWHFIQVAFVVILQVVLGFLSFAGWWALWNETSLHNEKIGGLIFHLAIPVLVLAWTARRGRPKLVASSSPT